ncbi:MAG: GtrA family protein [Sporichthyaceae bacterium]
MARSVDGARGGPSRTEPALSGNFLVKAVRERFGHLFHELAKFGVVGAVAYLVDIVTFNVLSQTVLDGRPLTAKIFSTVLATTVAFVGNRQWTFRHRARQDLRREYVLFFALNAVALAIALACLGISHYVLNFTSPLADNISANVIGMLLGTVFRFWTYRRFVFTEIAPVAEDPRPAPAAA